jgi:hypothetical protein
VVGFGNCSGRTLAAMTDDAAKFIQTMRDRRVAAEGLRAYIHQARLVEARVATLAAIHHAEIREPYLTDAALKMALQRHGIATVVDQAEVLLLIVTPLAEMILGRSDGQSYEQEKAYHAEGADGIVQQNPR